MEILCFCPPDNLIPFSPIIVSNFCGNFSINSVAAAKSHAFLNKRVYVIPEDVRAVGKAIMRHRISLTYEAEAEEITTEHIIQRIYESVPMP